MSVKQMMVFENDDLTRNLNSGKEALIKALQLDGVIDNSYDVDKLSAAYVLSVKDKGIFGKLYDKFFNQEDDGKYISCLRSMPNIKDNTKKDVDEKSTEQ